MLWDAETGDKLLTMTVESEVSAAAFSPDGSLIVGGGESVQLWDAETGELITTLPGYELGYVNAPAVSPDGKLLAVPGYPVRVYDLPTETELYTKTIGARTVAFSPDGSRLGHCRVRGGWRLGRQDRRNDLPRRASGRRRLGGIQPGRQPAGDGRIGRPFPRLGCRDGRRAAERHGGHVVVGGHRSRRRGAVTNPNVSNVVAMPLP